MKISVIIPVYNVEKYLARCLNSILAIKSVDWECILIDDGSTDDSWSIIRGYAEKYPDKFIARHKENGGVSSARNMGIELASGDRIMFVDPDDYLFPEADGFLKKALNEYGDKDQILYKFLRVYDDGKTEKMMNIKENCRDYNEMIIYNALTGYWAACGTLQLFKTSIIKKHCLRYDESMRVEEDPAFSYDYIMRSQSYAAFDEYIYAYYQRDGSASNKHCEKDWQDYIKYINKRFELIEYRKMILDKNQLRDMYFFHFRLIIGRFIDVYYHLPLREFKIKCGEILSIPEIKEIIDRSTKYMFLYFFVKRRMYTLFWIAAHAFKLLKKIRRKPQRRIYNEHD